MKSILLAAASLFLLAVPRSACAQEEAPPNIAGAPPKLLLLVHQEFFAGKAAERHKLEVAISHACDHLSVPNSWIALESLTGPAEALSFDPFDSFEQVDTAYAEWGRIFAAHSDLARMQEQVRALISSERTIIAVRRDDLGYRPQSIDFSKAHFLRVLEVRVIPGHESDFAEAFRILAGAYEKIRADTPWVVYQVNAGMPSPAFLVIVPMRTLKQNDDLLDWRRSVREVEGEEVAHRTEQIARDAYAFSETNLYAISPEMSHVSQEFAEGDPSFWSPKPAPAPPKSAPRKESESMQKP